MSIFHRNGEIYSRNLRSRATQLMRVREHMGFDTNRIVPMSRTGVTAPNGHTPSEVPLPVPEIATVFRSETGRGLGAERNVLDEVLAILAGREARPGVASGHVRVAGISEPCPHADHPLGQFSFRGIQVTWHAADLIDVHTHRTAMIVGKQKLNICRVAGARSETGHRGKKEWRTPVSEIINIGWHQRSPTLHDVKLAAFRDVAHRTLICLHRVAAKLGERI